MSNGIIKDFDQFKKVNESDMSLFGWIAGQAGNQLGKTIKEKATSMLLEYMGIPSGDPNDPEGRGQWIREIFVKVIGNTSLEEMDEIIKGNIPVNSGDFWCEKIAKALKEQIIDSGPRASDVINLLGVTTEGFIGRLITNMYREFILDEKNLEQMLVAAWRLVTEEEFIPQKDAGELYREAYDKLTPEQKKKVQGSVWKSSMGQMDFLKRK
jgi:hypothetical protein